MAVLPEDIPDDEVSSRSLNFQEKSVQSSEEDKTDKDPAVEELPDAKKTSQLVKELEEEKKETAYKSMIPDKFRKKAITYEAQGQDGQIMQYNPNNNMQIATTASAMSLASALNSNSKAIVLRKQRVVKPQWHAPWKLMRVISGHQGWVRAIAVDVTNRWFVTGSRDKTIKFWDLVEGTLMMTLTGHISTIRGL